MGAGDIIARLLERYGPVAARELAPTAARMAPETTEVVSKPVLEDIMAQGGGWLEKLLGRAAPVAPGAVAPTAGPLAESPAISDQLYARLSPYLRQLLREPAIGRGPRPLATSAEEEMVPSIPKASPPGPVPQGLVSPAQLLSKEPPAPAVPTDFPVTRAAYRGEPRVQPMGAGFGDLLRTRGLKSTALSAKLQELVEQLQASGQLPRAINYAEAPGSDVLESLYGSKPSALLGEAGEIGVKPSEVGRLWAQFQRLSPEETLQRIGTPSSSPILREGQQYARAERGAEEMQKLGETRDFKDIVADLLRGGPSPTGRGEFAEKVLYPIMKARAQANLPAGQPLDAQAILKALSGQQPGKFLRTAEGRPQMPSGIARQEFIQRVLKILQSINAKRALGGQ